MVPDIHTYLVPSFPQTLLFHLCFVLFSYFEHFIFSAEEGVSGPADAGRNSAAPRQRTSRLRGTAMTEAHLQCFSIVHICPMLSFCHFCCVLFFFLLLLSRVFLLYLAQRLQRLTLLGFYALQMLMSSAHRKHTVIRHGRSEVRLFLVYFPEQIPSKLARSDH